MFPLQKDIWTEVISLYKNMPFLWDKSDPKYTSRQSREIGYNIILQKYKEHDKHANMAVLKKKIDNMRTSYRRELKKVLLSKRNSLTPEDRYVPELWYFDSLSFLDKHIVLQHNRDSSDEDDMELSHITESQSYTDDSSNFNPSIENLFYQDFEYDNDILPRKKRKKVKREIPDELGDADTLDNVQEDDWLVVGKSIGVQLKGLDSRQSAIAQKIIAETLFYAKLGKLKEYSTVSFNEPHKELSDF
ncbi:uncharacterized protein LOC115447531 [Manduca sexta]|uniref:MADF domain-containing protein n=1 Tax=Manduca sexta TaxID=7130 RepID=A0A921ZF61_MANSE|nr:uncharacterized protein LOC115447531 [Manduca sexta]KAG6456480.1 hypothetical protein O3G_MSEX009754 [Manduca sexta]